MTLLSHTKEIYMNGKLHSTVTSYVEEGKTIASTLFTPEFEKKTLVATFVSNNDGTGRWIRATRDK